MPTNAMYAIHKAALLHKNWDSDYVVYHIPSGETHLLNKQASELLLMIQEQPQRRDALFDYLVRQSLNGYVDRELESEIDDYLSALLDEFCRMNLIEKTI